MKVSLAITLFYLSLASAQNPGDARAARQLEQILNLHPQERIQERARRKVPAVDAFHRQLALDSHDCEAQSKQGQQPYNICMGNAVAETDKDFLDFYNNLELLMWNQDDLRRLQETQAVWLIYRTKAVDAAVQTFGQGTAGPGEGDAGYLMLTRDRMRELYRIYGLNFAQ